MDPVDGTSRQQTAVPFSRIPSSDGIPASGKSGEREIPESGIVGNGGADHESLWHVPGKNVGLPVFDKRFGFPYIKHMVKDAEYFDRQKRTWLSQQHLSIGERFRILDALYDEARLFGHFQRVDLLTGLDDDVHLAAILNANVSNPSR